jgi:hypothetical protein
MRAVPGRFWPEVPLAAASGMPGLIATVRADWLEAVFGIDPDGHGGSLEWLAVLGLVTAAVTIAAVPGADWRHADAGRL